MTNKCRFWNPDRISTSLIERQNLTVRMSMRRLTRLTNAFSKKLDNLKAATALHFAHYNLCRIHKTISVKHLPRYLREREFHWNRRHATDGERTVAAIQGAKGKRLEYQLPLGSMSPSSD